MHMNEKLLQNAMKWENQVLPDFFRRYSKEEVSRPFCLGVSNEYIYAERRIMVIGQQTNQWDSYRKSIDWKTESVQQWCVKYLERQVFGWHKEELDNNPSPFWAFFKQVSSTGWVPCWNNIDKMQSVTKDGDMLSDKQREILFQGIFDGKTLLQKEIEVTKPDRVVFIVGPVFKEAICKALGVSGEALNGKELNSVNMCDDITKETGLQIPTFWSYHPKYLRLKGKMNECIDKILKD